MFFVVGMLGFSGVAVAGEITASWWSRLGLHDLNDAPVSAKGRWVVMVFISPECPVANASIPVLNALAAEFAPAGFDFVGVYADPTLELPVLKRHTADYHLGFATVDDRAQRLVHLGGATYTPETLVFSRDGALLYRGRIDDRVTDFGASRPAATHQDLRDVLCALAAGKPVPFASRPGFGCSIPEVAKR
ncbi:MAG TPA: redoxin domain-containing protein [Lacunisphaera sp.]|jgi:thiol-disulfide isomerase/thioredoxin